MTSATAIDVTTAEDARQAAPGAAEHRSGSRKTLSFDVQHPASDYSVSCTLTSVKAGGENIRHHHVFDQVRYICEGHAYFQKRKCPPGTLIYTSESVFYGPQPRREDYRVLTFQFPGPSELMPLKSRQLSVDQFTKGIEGLKAAGVVFRDRLAIFPDGKKQEPAEAVYEFMAGGPLSYAPTRYADPIYIFTNNFAWQSTNAKGVSTRHFAYFNECGPNLSMLRLEPGAVVPAGQSNCIDIRVVLNGDVECEGRSCAAVSRLYFPPDVKHGAISSKSGAELLVFQIAVPGGIAPALDVI